jgi:hypothetical protein
MLLHHLRDKQGYLGILVAAGAMIITHGLILQLIYLLLGMEE